LIILIGRAMPLGISSPWAFIIKSLGVRAF
jgi:hypothetical protein